MPEEPLKQSPGGTDDSSQLVMAIQVNCSHDKMVPLRDLISNPRNPNQHPPAHVELLAKIIEKSGWRVPIVVSTLSGFIVSGHGRYEAAKKLGAETVPVDYQDFDNPAAEWSHLIADNQISELSSINKDLLKDLILEVDAFSHDPDWDLTGFSTEQVEKMMLNAPPAPDLDKKKTHTCPSCGYVF